ncbi:MAG TPA: methyltransferase domain-containing protein [Rubrobacteraceae bacterium]|nr:methyltransferase domain-containing protein [Rubrobacteraceae bacterium]
MASKYETRVDLENPHSSHALIVELVGHDKRVLDVGCASGYLAAALAERGCDVVGIEVDPEAARRAEEHCERVLVGDVESMDLDGPLEQEAFDVIVFGDVLEHLKEPLRTLERLKPFLRDDGFVVASIPNVAHGSVRLALFQGRFQYQRLGLMDDTHLRFFTRESVERLFDDAGLPIIALRRTIRGIFDTEIEVDQEEVPREVLQAVRTDPEALTYQFVATAYRAGEAAVSAKRIRLLSEQVAERDRMIYELNRRVRNFEELQRMLESRTEELAAREGEVTALAREVADVNVRLARLVQFGREEA